MTVSFQGSYPLSPGTPPVGPRVAEDHRPLRSRALARAQALAALLLPAGGFLSMP